MTPADPRTKLEKKLSELENWPVAKTARIYWFENRTDCDICRQQISGRHMIDGLRKDRFESALMCPSCHKSYGSGFGEGLGQLFTRLSHGRWILTHGFSEDLIEADDE